MHAPPDTFRTGKRREAGVSIVLAMLVLFVLVVVLFQVRFTASVEMDQARAFVDATRMNMLADAAFQQAQTQLLLDVDQPADEAGAAAGPEAGSDPIDGGGGGGLPGMPDPDPSEDDGDVDGGAGSDEEASISDTTASTDSLLDEWQDSSALAPALGQDYTMYVEVEDEDSKINLLGLWNPDKQIAEKQREIVARLLDKAFEGTSRDLSAVDASDILDKLNDWVAGSRGSFDPVPVPKLKASNADDEEAGKGLDTAVIDTANNHYPLTLGELSDIEGITPERLSGFIEDDTFFPGLERYLTISSNLEVKPKPKIDEDAFGGSPFTQGSLFDKKSAGSSTTGSSSGTGNGTSGGGKSGFGGGPGGSTPPGSTGTGGETGAGTGDDEETFDASNDGLVNVNTAPLIVLRALAPDDIPTSFIEKIIEFRNEIKVLEAQGALDQAGGSLFDNGPASDGSSGSKDKGKDSSDSGATGSGSSGFGDDKEDEKVVDFVFTAPDEVVNKVEQKYDIALNLDPGVNEDFASLLTTTSQVFTIKILILDKASGRRASYRGTIWRLTGGEQPEIVTLLPLEPAYDPRRLKDFPEDLSDISDERFTYAADKLAREQDINLNH